MSRQRVKLPAIREVGVVRTIVPAEGWLVESYRDQNRTDHWRIVEHDYEGMILPWWPKYFDNRADAEACINGAME